MLSLLRHLSAPCVLLCVLAVPVLAHAADTADGPARLVADLAPESESLPLSATSLAPLGNRAVFLRPDNESPAALWTTDGTPEGTTELAVLCPPCSAVLLGSTGNLAFYQPSESGPSPRIQIWRTDGTKAGTFPVMTGITDRIPASLNGGRLFFTACMPGQGCEVWSSDGTVAGTALAGEIAPGPANANVRKIVAAGGSGDKAFVVVGPSSLWVADRSGVRYLRDMPKLRFLVAGGGRAFFVAEAGDGGLEVWTSDGTAAGTRPVTSFGPKSPFGRNATAWLVEGRFYFTARHGKGNELWSVGSTPDSLRRLTDFSDPNSYFSSIRKAGSRTLFLAQLRYGPPKLWTSRGDFRSTAPVSRCPGGCPDVEGALAPLGQGRFAFHSNSKTDALWVTDGTGPGTRQLKASGRYHDLSQFTPLGDRVLFELTNEYEVGDLWLTDGTAAGTFFLAQGGPSWSHYWGWGGSLVAARVDGRLLFEALPDPENSLNGALLSSDGSPGGMREIARIEVGKSSYPQQLLPLGDRLLFQTCTGPALELYAVHGTETSLLLSQPYESSCGGPTLSYRYAALDDRAAFLTFSPTDGSELWGTDGTPAGTAVLIPAALPNEPADVVRFGDRFAVWMIVPTSTAEYGSQIWVSDGTPAGTGKLLDLPAGTEMYSLTEIGGKLYFYDAAPDGSNFWMHAWVSDGTAAGTRQLTGIKASTPDLAFIEADGRVWFRLIPQGGRTEIWSTDGTPAGTGPAVTGASGMLDPQLLTGAGGRLYFAARRAADPKGPFLPWVSDGTDAGTTPLAEVAIEETGELSYDYLRGERPGFTELGGRVYFSASDPAHGDELWSTDGTPQGTALVKDLAPGLLGSYPRSLVVWHDRLWFRARDLAHGMELWTGDGTAEGTHLLQDLSPGPSWSTPQELILAGGSLYFSAHDGAHGRELWELPEEP